MKQLTDETVCPHCGYDSREPVDVSDSRLAPQTVLQSRYIVGRLRYKNPDSYRYLAYDCVLQAPVTIREYLPPNLCRRGADGMTLIPNENSLAQYKALLSDFYDLAKTISALKNVDGILPTLNIFQENGTVYVVYKRIKTLKLTTFIDRTGGKLEWMVMREIFLQFCNTMAHLHEAGVIHRGISMETVRIDEDGILWLTDFCIPSARTYKSELTAKLYSGYSAPEQYSLNTWQGTWTDVYAAAAVIYTTLTGVTPQSAPDRKKDDKLFYANQVDEKVPANVSVALYNAMKLSTDQRTRTIENFTAQLLQSISDDTIQYDAAVLERQRQQEEERLQPKVPPKPVKKAKPVKRPVKPKKNKTKKPKKERNIPYVIVILSIICLLVMCVTAYFIYELLSVVNEPPKKQPQEPYQVTSAVTSQTAAGVVKRGVEVPNLVGKFGEDIQKEYENNSNFVLAVEKDSSNEYAEGYIFKQYPEPGEMVKKGEALIIWVSTGGQQTTMPYVVGLSESEAKQRLIAAGLDFHVEEVNDRSLTKGKIAGTNFTEGSSIDSDATVILYIRAEHIPDPEPPKTPSKPSESQASKPSGSSSGTESSKHDTSRSEDSKKPSRFF